MRRRFLEHRIPTEKTSNGTRLLSERNLKEAAVLQICRRDRKGKLSELLEWRGESYSRSGTGGEPFIRRGFAPLEE